MPREREKPSGHNDRAAMPRSGEDRAAGDDNGAPQTIAALCRTARGGTTIAVLAKRAKVSNRSISTIEDGKLPAELRAGKDDDRKTRTWAFILAKLALALNQDPEEWVEVAGISLPTSELKDIKGAARRRISPATRPEADTLAKLRAELQAQPDEPDERVTVDVHLLTSDESTLGQKTFYDQFCRLLLRTINPRLEPKPTPEVRTFEDVMAGLTASPPRHRLVVGAFQMVGRTQHRVIFIPIPGWRIRLGALALRDSGVSWEDIRQSGKSLPEQMQGELRVMVIAREAADVYLRSFCDFTFRQLTRIQDYDIQGAANAFHRELKRNPRAVFVVGEYEASVVRNILRDKYDYDLVDLAAETETAPRYQLALAVAESDERWARTLRNAIDELFKNDGAMMADLYGRYMMAVVKEIVAAEKTYGVQPKDAVRQVLGVTAPEGEVVTTEKRKPGKKKPDAKPGTKVPSYLQLHEIEFPVSNAFRHGLRDYLQKEFVRRKLIGPDEAFGPYFRRLAPWLRSDQQKTLRTARNLRLRMQQMTTALQENNRLLRQLTAREGRAESEGE